VEFCNSSERQAGDGSQNLPRLLRLGTRVPAEFRLAYRGMCVAAPTLFVTQRFQVLPLHGAPHMAMNSVYHLRLRLIKYIGADGHAHVKLVALAVTAKQ
jgi:hypothetical protein